MTTTADKISLSIAIFTLFATIFAAVSSWVSFKSLDQQKLEHVINSINNLINDTRENTLNKIQEIRDKWKDINNLSSLDEKKLESIKWETGKIWSTITNHVAIINNYLSSLSNEKNYKIIYKCNSNKSCPKEDNIPYRIGLYQKMFYDKAMNIDTKNAYVGQGAINIKIIDGLEFHLKSYGTMYVNSRYEIKRKWQKFWKREILIIMDILYCDRCAIKTLTFFK